MEELISYRHSSRLKLGMWLGAAVMVAFIYAYQSASANPSDSYIVRIVQIGILAFFWVFFLRRAGIHKLADEVRDLGDQLQIRRGKIIEVVPLARVSLVEASAILGTMPVVRLTFVDKVSIGDHIAFLPRYVAGQGSWSSEASNLALELQARINSARRNPAN